MDRPALQRITAWCQTHPSIVSYLASLNEHKVDWAVYAGASVNLLTGSREPTDVDIIVNTQGFKIGASLSPADAELRDDDPLFRCGDGAVLDFPANGLAFQLDGLDIDLMATGPASHGDHVYRLGLSRLAIDNRLHVQVGDLAFYLFNPFDTIAIKAIMQRGRDRNKFDFEDIQALAGQYHLNPIYVLVRSRELNLDRRVWAFCEKAGLRAPAIYSTITSVNNVTCV